MKKHIYILLFPLILFAGCAPESHPIEFGTDICHYCKMTIVDQRYGAQIVTKKGRVYNFDATECMVNAVYSDKMIAEENIHSLLAVAFDQPRLLVPVSEGFFLQSPTLPSPMGMFLTCFSSEQELEKASAQNAGSKLLWEGVKQEVLEKKPL